MPQIRTLVAITMENILSTNICFRPYLSKDKAFCLAIFNASTPKFFALNERLDYSQFLDSNPTEY
jgi:hypothetical protein